MGVVDLYVITRVRMQSVTQTLGPRRILPAAMVLPFHTGARGWRRCSDSDCGSVLARADGPIFLGTNDNYGFMSGEGPFLWLSKSGPPAGFWQLPPGGMCVCAFLFVKKDGKILLGKYADDPKLEELTGLDARRRQVHGKGLTIPATHLKFGEDPRDAAKRVGEDVLLLRGMRYSEPRVEVDTYPSRDFPGNMHSDLWFLVDATPPEGLHLRVPPWYAELGWHDPTTVPPEAYARSHVDVVARWRQMRSV